MFGKPKEKIPNIPLLTIDHFPGRDYEIIGLITTDALSGGVIKLAKLEDCTPSILEAAFKLQADAVIGLRFLQFNNAMIYAYGTAIRF